MFILPADSNVTIYFGATPLPWDHHSLAMPSTDQQAIKPSPIHSLTGMRFFAALIVVFVHSFQMSTGSGDFGPAATNAVTFFFVLSGFILTYVYHQRISKIGTLKFYVARIARIWPLHVVCFALTIWVDWCFGTGGLWAEQDWLKMGTHLGLIHSWIPIESWSMRYNGPAWSISTELGFYLLFPLLLLVAKRGYGKMLIGSFFITATIVVLMQIAVVSEIFGWYFGVETCYINPIVRAFDFAVGMWVASIFLRRQAIPVKTSSNQSVIKDTVFECLALVLTVFLFYQLNYGAIHDFIAPYQLIVCKSWLSRGGAVMPGYIAILLVFSTSQGMIGRFLSKPFIVYLGEISFAIYLVQIAVLLVLINLLNQESLPTPYFMLLAISLVIGVSMLLHSIVEMPMRQFLVALAGFKREKMSDSFLLCWRGLVRNGVGLIGVSICLFASGLIWYESEHPKANGQIVELLDAVKESRGSKFNPVVFEGEATLYWLDIVEHKETVEITMWWLLDEVRHQRIRFMHFSNEAGGIEFQGYSNARQFVGAPGGSFVLDNVRIKKSDITPDTKYFGVGFWSKATGACLADSGKRQMANRRLIIAEVTADSVNAVGIGSHAKE